MVDKLRLSSPNISMHLVTKLVQVRKNFKCLGISSVEDLYEVIEVYEGPEYVSTFIGHFRAFIGHLIFNRITYRSL